MFLCVGRPDGLPSKWRILCGQETSLASVENRVRRNSEGNCHSISESLRRNMLFKPVPGEGGILRALGGLYSTGSLSPITDGPLRHRKAEVGCLCVPLSGF